MPLKGAFPLCGLPIHLPTLATRVKVLVPVARPSPPSLA